MDPGLRDYLQLGFSFGVAAWLLVQQTRLVSALVVVLQTQGATLEAVKASLVRLESLVQFIVTSAPPRGGMGGG